MEDDENVVVDSRGELWLFYGTANDGTRIYTPQILALDETRDSKREEDIGPFSIIEGIRA